MCIHKHKCCLFYDDISSKLTLLSFRTLFTLLPIKTYIRGTSDLHGIDEPVAADLQQETVRVLVPAQRIFQVPRVLLKINQTTIIHFLMNFPNYNRQLFHFFLPTLAYSSRLSKSALSTTHPARVKGITINKYINIFFIITSIFHNVNSAFICLSHENYMYNIVCNPTFCLFPLRSQ